MAASKPQWQIEEHIHEAKRNYERYLLMLQNEDNVSWATVFLFYSAIHLIQSYARRDTPTDIPSNHESRRNYVAYYLPENIAANYMELDDVSKLVRYNLRRKSPRDVRTLHDDHFSKIRKHFREELSTSWTSPNTLTISPIEVENK